MKRIKRTQWFVLTLILAAFVLSACSGGSGGKDAKTGLPETVRIAVTEGSPPFSFFNDQGEVMGFDVDYANEIAKRMGVKAEIMSIEWDSMIPGLTSDKYDLIVGSMAITETRLQTIDFSHVYYTSGAAVIVRNDETAIQTPADLAGKVVGVTVGTTYEEEAVALGAEVKTYDTEAAQLVDLENERIDAVITDKFIGAYAIKEGNRPLKLLSELLYDEELGIGMRKNEPALLEAVNKAVDEINADGTYGRLAEKWFGVQ